MDAAKLRAWWFQKQGLGAERFQSLAEVLSEAGWARSVGGVNPYLTLHARGGFSRERTDRDVAEARIHELPSARGCTYVVPEGDYGLALTLAHANGEGQDVKTAKKYLSFTDKELQRLEDAVLKALKARPQDPKELRDSLGDLVRSFGDEGKKRGVTSSLPLALGRLQTGGKIRRIPSDGRLDGQRYRYALWPVNPTAAYNKTTEEAHAEIARRYFQWIGPATMANFRWFSGLGAGAAKKAVETLGLRPIESGSDFLILPEELDTFSRYQPPREPRFALISSIDSLLLHRRDVQSQLDQSDLGRKVRGEKLIQPAGGLQDLPSHAIVDRGRIVGLWEYDPAAKEIVWQAFIEPDKALRRQIEATEAFVRDELGDARSYSLDSPESRRPKIDFLRSHSLAAV